MSPGPRRYPSTIAVGDGAASSRPASKASDGRVWSATTVSHSPFEEPAAEDDDWRGRQAEEQQTDARAAAPLKSPA